MQNKKVIILAILSIFAVISLIYGITAKPKPKTAAAVYSANKELPASLGALPVERRAGRSKFTAWKRSPFIASGAPASPNLILSGIIWSENKPKAMISNAIVTKGSEIEGFTVIDIKPDRVILNDGTKNLELKLEK